MPEEDRSGAVRARYDRLASAPGSPFREHIHHGYWCEGSDLLGAQTRLIEKLAEFARLPRGAHVLDVGCGTGGAARWLAQELGCAVLGLSISEKEIASATKKARDAGLADRLEFRVLDANQLDLSAAHFDVVWVLETSEHLADRPKFFANCARILKPNGSLALGACIARENPDAEQAKLLANVTEVLLTEPLGHVDDYVGWLGKSGFERVTIQDVTRHVRQTWPRISAALRHSGRAVGFSHAEEREMRRLLTTMRSAYARQAIAYVFVSANRSARSPEETV